MGRLLVLAVLAASSAPATSSVPSVRIADGVDMPMLAFGTAKSSLTSCSAQQGVEQWLQLGGRHIDTADTYGTQPDVGRALHASGVPRSEVFITTKVPGPVGKQGAIDNIVKKALLELGVDYVDLVLIHWPCKGMDAKDFPGCVPADADSRRDTWAGLAELRAAGKIRAAGVSNFDDEQVREIVSAFQEPPAVNQVEFHLAYHNETLLQAMRGVGTTPEAWASLGGPTVHGNPTVPLGDARLRAVAERYNASTAQVALRWETQKGVVPVTATCSKEHALGDLAAFDFVLSQTDMAYLDALRPTQPLVVV
uniref:NADP-dependent oxidoreductase domain-containing protein n=1 Tax=Alexandrium catenella TaxID=2925 RepID=A0A7S1SCS2_ALECA